MRAGRDDLLDLMDDAVMAEVVVPDEALAHGWREALRAIAASSYQAFLRHPWMLQVTRGNGGPSTLRHFEQSLHAASLTGLDERGQIEAMSTVDDYVFGFILRSRFSDQHEHEAAFATTVHKAQGSEFDRVVVVLPAQASPVPSRTKSGFTNSRSTGIT